MLIDHSNDRFILLQAHLGGDRNFCYLIGDRRDGECAVVDPGYDAPGVLALATKQGLKIRRILITHGHKDHCAEAAAVANATGATVHAGGADRVPGAEAIDADREINLGDLRIKALQTPGHTPGHLCYLCEGHLCTGDILFCGKVGGTGDYFPGSSAARQWESLHRLLELPDETLVLPGHDYYGGQGLMPHSTIGYERDHNPFLLSVDFEAFETLKANWATYKETHGIR